MNALEISHLEFRHGEGFHLGPLDLALAPGSRTALVGHSGAGKSTLLRCIAGLEKPSAGAITIDGAVAFDGRERLAPHARGIGFVFQGGGLWPHLDALEHLRFAAPKLPVDDAAALLGRLGLAGKETRKPAELSGGEAQRLSLARALATKPRILLLDEPLRSLDVHLRIELCLLIRSTVVASGTTLLAVTHDREEALLLADDAVVLDGGRVAERGPLSRMQREPRCAHAASLVAEATCLRVDGNGTLSTAFGPVKRPSGTRGALALALLPGDVELANGDRTAEGTVLFGEPKRDGAVLHVELGPAAIGGASARILVEHETLLPAGSRVGLRLRGAPRILPYLASEETP